MQRHEWNVIIAQTPFDRLLIPYTYCMVVVMKSVDDKLYTVDTSRWIDHTYTQERRQFQKIGETN